MNEADLNYVAGLFDGEGHCRIGRYKASKNGKFYERAIATITNTDRRGLDFVQKVFNKGSVTTSQRPVGRKTVYRWTVTNSSAVEILKLIRPYLKIRGEQVDLVC